MGEVILGTSSWNYPSWKGLLYREGDDSTNYLTQYAKHYNSVEIDQWFWSLGKESLRLPARETVNSYDKATGSDFRFTVKCPNALTLTHHYTKEGPLRPNPYFLDPNLFMAFYAALGPLQSKIGLYIFQFEYLNRDKMASQSQFLAHLEQFFSALPPDLPYGVEIRNPLYLNQDYFLALQKGALIPVLVEGYWMESVVTTIERYQHFFPNTLCLRLHGSERKEMERMTGQEWNQIVRPNEASLVRIIGAVKALLYSDNMKIYLTVNNHYEGSAPLTLEKIKALLS